VINEQQIKLPFNKANDVKYESDNELMYFANRVQEQVFYKHTEEGWQKVKYNINEKFLINKIIGNFVIARYQGGQAYILEMKNEDVVLQVQLGDRDIWNFEVDADCRLQSFCLQFQKKGKNFFWQKFDMQQ